MANYYSTSGCELTIDKNSEYVYFKNTRELGAIYSFNIKRFKELLTQGGKQWRVPSKCTDAGFIYLSFQKERRHLSNRGSSINTFFDKHDYELMMKELEEIIGA